MIHKSLSALPKYQLILFGLSEIFDGFVTVLSLGLLTSHLSMRVISNFTRKHHQRRNK
jgi:hypothetical protein